MATRVKGGLKRLTETIEVRLRASKSEQRSLDPQLEEPSYLDHHLLALAQARMALEGSEDPHHAALEQLSRRERELRSWLPPWS